MKEEARSEDSDVDGRTTIKRLLKNEDFLTWTGFVWLGIGIGDELNEWICIAVIFLNSNKTLRTFSRVAYR
jgi:hypothetical protein